MLRRNVHLAKLKAGYLFPEIHKRKVTFLEKNPTAKLISLGVGDTTEPIPAHIDQGLIDLAAKLGTAKDYMGYGPDQGRADLREAIANKLYNGKIHSDEIFISDGVKPDIGRLQILFDAESTVAVQDPAYPVYVDTSLISGKKEVKFLPCTPENNFFPDLDNAPPVDIVYFCSPNNPTGAVATHEELTKLVAWVKKIKAVLLFDTAYSAYIRDESLPRSIYEIEGAKECAIEMNSLSKMAGFSGVRLAWTVVPNDLKFEDGTQVKKDWHRIFTTFFNGASLISQGGAFQAISDKGLEEIRQQTNFYLENAKILRTLFIEKGYQVFGGDNAPYIWVQVPKKSWEFFEDILEKCHIVTTPGSGFGPAGEGFVRLSAFGHRETILEAAERLEKVL